MAQKFDFPESFDGAAALQRAAARKERLYSEAEMAQIKNEAWQKGQADALLIAQQAIEKELVQAVGVLVQRIETVAKQLESSRAHFEAVAIKMAIETARTVVPTYVQQHGLLDIETQLRELLSHSSSFPTLRIRVAASHVVPLQEWLEKTKPQFLNQAEIILSPDETLAAGDCRVEWADGGQERSVSRIWQEIDAAITAMIPSHNPSNPSPSSIA